MKVFFDVWNKNLIFFRKAVDVNANLKLEKCIEYFYSLSDQLDQNLVIIVDTSFHSDIISSFEDANMTLSSNYFDLQTF